MLRNTLAGPQNVVSISRTDPVRVGVGCVGEGQGEHEGVDIDVHVCICVGVGDVGIRVRYCLVMDVAGVDVGVGVGFVGVGNIVIVSLYRPPSHDVPGCPSFLCARFVGFVSTRASGRPRAHYPTAAGSSTFIKLG